MSLHCRNAVHLSGVKLRLSGYRIMEIFTIFARDGFARWFTLRSALVGAGLPANRGALEKHRGQ
jgi:hypothetical protein